MISSQAAGPAAQADASLSTVATVDDLIEQVETDKPQLVVLDLSLKGLNLEELTPQLRNRDDGSMKIIAFGPHVHEQQLETARLAGCDEVLTRGQFHSSMAQIFSDTV